MIGCRIDTLTHWVTQWSRFSSLCQSIIQWHPRSDHAALMRAYKALRPDQLSTRDVLLIADTEKIHLQDWAALLASVQKTGARLIMVGNEVALPSLEMGTIFQEILDKAQAQGSVQIVPVHFPRQRREDKEIIDSNFVRLHRFSCEWIPEYTIASNHKAAWKVVRRYQQLGQNLAAASLSQKMEIYQVLNTERIQLGKMMLQQKMPGRLNNFLMAYADNKRFHLDAHK